MAATETVLRVPLGSLSQSCYLASFFVNSTPNLSFKPVSRNRKGIRCTSSHEFSTVSNSAVRGHSFHSSNCSLKGKKFVCKCQKHDVEESIRSTVLPSDGLKSDLDEMPLPVNGSLSSNGNAQSVGTKSIEDEAWDLLRQSVVFYCGSPIGTIAANDPSSTSVLTTSEVLVKIAESTGLRSNQEILIEGVVLTNMKEDAELTDNDTEAEYLDGLISLTTRMHEYLSDIKQAQLRCPVRVPSDFRCSLSLELMTDPVIVASGQTYERVFIQKWIDMGLMVCPKTRQSLSHTTLTPNFIVRAFLASWCETNNVYPPDPLELIHSSQPFPLLLESVRASSSENSSPIKNGQADAEELRQVFSRSASAPGIVSEMVCKTKRSTNATAAADRSVSQARSNTPWKFPEERHWRHPGIIPATIRETGSSSSIETEVKKLIEDLKSSSLDTQREATARIRILSRNSTDNRIVIARCGAIPSLVSLLYSTDERIQADAVTCLLNLSINDNNKSLIAESGAIEPLIHVLKTGYLEEAKANSAATLFSLSVIEEYKTEIGEAGAIEPLVDLLGSGSLSGKKDAATALFNLSIHPENKTKVIEAGAVRYLVELMDPAFGMVEKAVVVLANLATVREGKIAIGEEGGIPVLVEVVELGSARGKENATAALLQLCTHSPKFCNSVIREGVIPPLVALTKSGTARGKEKAQNLLKYFKGHRQNNQRRG